MKNKKIIIVSVLVLIIILAIYFIASYQNKNSAILIEENNNASTTTQSSQVKSTSKTQSSSYLNKQGYYVVQYTNTGFVPKTLQVPKGKSIKFINMSSKGMRIFTNAETSDNKFVELNQPTTVSKGAEYTLTVPTSGLWNYYNQTYPSHSASIIVY